MGAGRNPPHSNALACFGCLSLCLSGLRSDRFSFLATLNRDLTGSALRFGDRDRHFQYTIVELCFGLFGLGDLGQRNFALERPIITLGGMDTAAFLVLLS